MQFFLFFALFANVFGQGQLRGSIDVPISDNDDSFHWKEFNNFQERFSKRYSNFEELETRFAIFRKNFIGILLHNADVTQNFTMAVNQFTDLTPEEFRAQYVGGLKTGVYNTTLPTNGATKSVVSPATPTGVWAFSANVRDNATNIVSCKIAIVDSVADTFSYPKAT